MVLPVKSCCRALNVVLDNVVFRLGIAPTRAAARQLVGHKHITVDGKVVNIPSFSVKPGQLVGVRERSKSLEVIANSLAGFNHSKYPWLEWDENSKEVSCCIYLKEQIFLKTLKNT